MSTYLSNRALDLAQVLQEDEPPKADQPISYSVDVGHGPNHAVLHGAECVQQSEKSWVKPVLQRHETTGLLLQQALKNVRFAQVCCHCYPNCTSHAQMLVRSSWEKPFGTDQLSWADCSMLLQHEVWKPGNELAWSRWLYNKTPDQIRKQLRKTVDWSDHEPFVLYHGAGGCDRRSWVVGLGEHVAAVDNRYGANNGLVVHGMVPERLAQYEQGAGCTGVIVKVKAGFDRQHLDVALNLYEDGVQQTRSTGRGYINTAEAVRYAELVLA